MTAGKTYWLLLALTLVGVAYYVKRQDLPGRYHAHQQREETLQKARQQVDDIKSKVESTQSRVDRLTTNPVEMEAALRRNKRLARPGETIYHMEMTSASEGSPGGASEGAASQPAASVPATAPTQP